MSLYQVLPRASGGQQQQQEEHGLRLLDIRRIDLDSSGWESFYAKRAVLDWLRDASSNLGEFFHLHLQLFSAAKKSSRRRIFFVAKRREIKIRPRETNQRELSTRLDSNRTCDKSQINV